MLRVPIRLHISTRCISSTAILGAPFKQKDGKTKQKMAKKVERVEVKKSTTLTHLPWPKAIQNLNLDKLAPKLPEIDQFVLEEAKIGKVYRYSSLVESKLNSLGCFKKYQFHEGFSKPITLSTTNTHRINSQFVEKLNNESKSNRVYLDGIKGIGKSSLMSQVISLSLDKYNHDIVILHMDNSEVIGNGSSNYIFNKKLNLYQQPMITRRWIKKILNANKDIFKKLKLTQDVKFTKDKSEIRLSQGKHTIYDYLSQNFEFGKIDPHSHFEFLINQLKHHSKEVPVLVSIDNFNAVSDFSLTSYKTPQFTPIHITQFELGKFIIDCASGDLNFSNGGVILAKSQDFAPTRKTIEVAVYPERQYENNYMKQPIFDLELSRKLVGISPFQLDSLTIDETRELLKMWRNQGILITRADFTEKDYSSPNVELEVNHDSQFERMVLDSYNTSQGNPLGMFKQIALTY